MRRGAKPKIRAGILSGWKDIASYLGMSVRTVQRYEKQARLPVRRKGAGKQGTVLATIEELDAWVNARPLMREFGMQRSLPQSYIVSFETFKKKIAEQQRIRKEMTKIREDVHTSVNILRETLRFLQEGPGGERRFQAVRSPSDNALRKVN